MSTNEIKALELKIDELILLCNQLNMENQSLKLKSANLKQEQSTLIEKNLLAKERMETMLEELRTVESVL